MDREKLDKIDGKIKWALLAVSLATIVFLVMAALEDGVLAEWRQFRLAYADVLESKATDARGRSVADQYEVRIIQHVIPEMNVTDRCSTCHAGTDDPRMVDEEQPFTTHPGRFLEVHPPDNFGCTVCHEGQGRATETADAHGRVAFWEHPMLEKDHMYSACAKCHDEQALYYEGYLTSLMDGHEPEAATLIAKGREILNSTGCLGCHVLDGRGGNLGPDMTGVGDKSHLEFDFSHFAKNEPREVPYWLKKHFVDPTAVSPDSPMVGMEVSEPDADALTAYVMSFRSGVGSGRLIPEVTVDRVEAVPPTGEELYLQLCAACHGIDGKIVAAPEIRAMTLNNVDSLAVASDNYLRYIIDKGRTGSAMPPWGPESGNLSYEEIDQVVAHIRSWEVQKADLGNVNAQAGEVKMGRAYYQGLCANCHGVNGEGGIGNALNSPTFLGVASDRFLAESIVHGRPGTAMASWKHLPTQAVSDLLAYMRSWQPEAPTFDEVKASLAAYPRNESEHVGGIVFRSNCASCHGANGEGGVGVRLNSANIVPAVSDEYLFRTIVEGRATTAMPAWRHLSADNIAALIAYMRSWNNGERQYVTSAPATGDYMLGEVHYRMSCAPCHGDVGEGGVGPRLSDPGFLRIVSDDLLYEWIGHGRADTAMRGFLSEEQGVTSLRPSYIADVIAYIRYLGSRDDRPIQRTGIGDPHVGAQLFEGNCASCHGVEGIGASGPQLHNATFLKSASDGFLAATMITGRIGTAMQSMVHGQQGLGQIEPEQVQDIIAYMRYWDVSDKWRLSRPVAEINARSISGGEILFGEFCAGCHGPNGLGEMDGPKHYAPSLNNPEFLKAASDGFLLATIARGRSNTPMRPFGIGTGGIAALNTEQISDIVSYIRSWQEADED
jgi:mono/diheme cytochrome c family protein